MHNVFPTLDEPFHSQFVCSSFCLLGRKIFDGLGLMSFVARVLYFRVTKFGNCLRTFFDVLLNMHLSIILAMTNPMHKFLFYNKFIIFFYMFRALSCSSSGGQNCIIQHLVSSHSVGGRPVRRLREDPLNLRTGRPPTDCDDTRCCIKQFYLLMMRTTVLETCRGI